MRIKAGWHLGDANMHKIALAAVAALLLSGCKPIIRDTFAVDVVDRGAVSAVLSICGAQTPMRRSGSIFRASYPIDCKGDGEVSVQYADGTAVACPIGYVTQDAGQHWRFVARRQSCQVARSRD